MNANYKFTLNIAGEIDRQNRSYLNKKYFESINKNSNIKFLGKCHNMREIYKLMDIVILPSWREGLSKSLLESAAMSLPIITTDYRCKDLFQWIFGFISASKKQRKINNIEKYLNNQN